MYSLKVTLYSFVLLLNLIQKSRIDSCQLQFRIVAIYNKKLLASLNNINNPFKSKTNQTKKFSIEEQTCQIQQQIINEINNIAEPQLRKFISTIKESNIYSYKIQAPQNDQYLFKLLERGRTKGFENFINRKLIWPYLLNLQYDKIQDIPSFEWKTKHNNKNSIDYEQLQKDAERSLSSMKTFENISKIHLKKRQDDVLLVLDNFFIQNPQLRYIQGFHDVTSVFLMIFGNNIGYYMMERSGKVYFHDFLKYDVGHIGIAVSSIVLDLVVSKDKDFEDIFSCFKQSKFLIFIIPWIFTWFAHVFSSIKTICRIWDYILCTGPYGAIYLTAGIILSTKRDLIESCQQFDQANIQTFYQKMAKNEEINIQLAIQKAIQLQSMSNVQQFKGYQDFKQDSMFRFNNYYEQIPIIKKYAENVKKQKLYQKRIGYLKTAGLMVFTVGVAVLAANKYNGTGKIKLGNWQL